MLDPPNFLCSALAQPAQLIPRASELAGEVPTPPRDADAERRVVGESASDETVGGSGSGGGKYVSAAF